MFRQRRLKQIGARLDGETRYQGAAAPDRADEEAKRYEEAVLQLRRGASRAARTPEISDAQFGAFMRGIQEGIEAPAPRRVGAWTVASVTLAVLVIVVSILAFFTAGPEPVRATEVESASTELEGVTVNFYDTPQGVSTVRVNMPESDLW